MAIQMELKSEIGVNCLIINIACFWLMNGRTVNRCVVICFVIQYARLSFKPIIHYLLEISFILYQSLSIIEFEI